MAWWPWNGGKREPYVVASGGEDTSVLRLKILGQNNEIEAMKKVIAEQEEKLRKYQVREYIDFQIGDPIPDDAEKRRAYVSAVAGLYHDILYPKLKQMIATCRAVLENPENTRDQDLEMKGTIYALWELIRWGDLMVGEDKANMAGQDPSSPRDKEIK